MEPGGTQLVTEPMMWCTRRVNGQGDDMRTKIGLIVAAASLVASCAADAPTGPPFRTDATVAMLMANMVDPAADLVWDAVGTIVDENGENHWEPETEEDWISVRYGAMSMIEAGNLLMMETRARDQDQWIRLSEAMMDAGTLMFQAAEAEDADRVFALGEDVYNACNNCHTLYWVDDADRGRAIESPSGGAAP